MLRRCLTSKSSWQAFKERVSIPNMRSGSVLLYFRSLPFPTFRVPPLPQYTITFFLWFSCAAAFLPNSGSLSAAKIWDFRGRLLRTSPLLHIKLG